MSGTEVKFVRIYLEESRDDIKSIMKSLQKADLKGFTVFRGIAGAGDDKSLHTAGLIDILPSLPIVIEFFDTPDNINKALPNIADIKPDHVVSWMATLGI